MDLELFGCGVGGSDWKFEPGALASFARLGLVDDPSWIVAMSSNSTSISTGQTVRGADLGGANIGADQSADGGLWAPSGGGRWTTGGGGGGLCVIGGADGAGFWIAGGGGGVCATGGGNCAGGL